MSARVFVVQDQKKFTRGGKPVPKFDLTPAAQYGQLVYLLDNDASPLRSAEIVDRLHEKLHTYRSSDYLLLIGNPCLIGMVVSVAAFWSGGKVRMLQWDAMERHYEDVLCDMRFKEHTTS